MALFHRFGDVVFDLMLQNGSSGRIEGDPDRRNLGQHLVTIAPFPPEPFEACGMPSNASEALGKYRQMLNVNNKFLAMVITAAVTDHSAGPPPPTGSGCSRSWAALARKLSKPIMSRMTE